MNIPYKNLIDIDLFAGGGGLAVGLRIAGFNPTVFIEADKVCCKTINLNINSNKPTLSGKVFLGKAEEVEWSPFKNHIRLLAGGAPCQPFSLGGKHYAHRDKRNLFPEVLRAVHQTRPIAVLLENVRGMIRQSFGSYFNYILQQLRFPSIIIRDQETWQDHSKRLLRTELTEAPEYRVESRLLNAADYGVPQNRLRVFIVATRIDFPSYSFPKKTHGREALLRALHGKYYWERHGLKRPSNVNLNNQLFLNDDGLLRWVTVRDALHGLPFPVEREEESNMNHWIIPGARSYDGHTGSIMDWPAKTIKAGVHGVPGGENTVIDAAGKFRYFTLREIARLQSFPDKHIFEGKRSQITKQIGNAVPCLLASAIAAPLYSLIRDYLEV